MADQEERVRIQFDSNAGQVAGQVNSLGNSLDGVNDSATETTRTMHGLDASFEDVYGDIRPLTAQLGELEDRLYQLRIEGQHNTQEFRNLTAEAGRLRLAQQEVDRAVDATATTLGQRLGSASQIAASGISAVTSGMVLFGGASEETEKALLKVQAAMAFADSISSLSDLQSQFTVFKDLVVSGYRRILLARQAEIAATTQATIAQRILNITALANPYVLLGAGIAALTVVTYAWVKSSKEQAKALEVATNAVSLNKAETEALSNSIALANENTSNYNNLEVARAKALGLTDKEIQKLIQSQKELEVTTARTFSFDAYQNVLKAMEAARQARKTLNSDLIKEAEENQKAAEDLYKKANDAFNNAIISEGVNRLTVQGEQLKAQQDAEKKALEERKKKQDEAHKYEQELIRLRGEQAREAYEKELKDYEIFKARIIEAKILGDQDEAARVQESLDEITKGEDERLLKRIETEQKIYEYRLQMKKELRDREYDIALSGIALAANIFGKSKAVQKGALIAEGAVNIAKTVQGTFTGNAAALAQGIVQAGPIIGPGLAAPAIVLNSVQGGLSVAGTVAATAKGLQALGGGSAPSASVGSSSAGSSVAAPPAVQFNNSAENQIGQSIAKAQTEQPPLQVVVSESDITNAQNNVKVLVNTNTFG